MGAVSLAVRSSSCFYMFKCQFLSIRIFCLSPVLWYVMVGLLDLHVPLRSLHYIGPEDSSSLAMLGADTERALEALRRSSKVSSQICLMRFGSDGLSSLTWHTYVANGGVPRIWAVRIAACCSKRLHIIESQGHIEGTFTRKHTGPLLKRWFFKHQTENNSWNVEMLNRQAKQLSFQCFYEWGLQRRHLSCNPLAL